MEIVFEDINYELIDYNINKFMKLSFKFDNSFEGKVIYNKDDGFLIDNGLDPKPILANCVSIFWITLICWQMTAPLRFLYESVYPKKDIVYHWRIDI